MMVDATAQAAQMAVGLCFAYATLAKTVTFAGFEKGVASYELLRQAWIRPVSVVVIAIEALIAVSFLSGFAPLFGATVAIVLLTAFAFATASAHQRGLIIACMCFGPGAVESTAAKTLARVAFLALGVALVFFNALRDQSATPAPWWASMVGGLCLLTGSVVILELSPLLATVVMRRGRRQEMQERDNTGVKALPAVLALCLLPLFAAAANEANPTVRGKVVGQVPGNPVWVGVLAGEKQPVWTRAEKGRFEAALPLEPPNESASLLVVSKDRVPLAMPLSRDATAEAAGEEVELRLSPGLRLAGTVLSEGGKPLPGAALHVKPAEGAGFEMPPLAKLRWESDRRGEFVIDGLRPGRHVVRATAEAHIPLELDDVQVEPESDEADEDGVNRVELRLAPAFFVTGRVFDSDGAPVAGAQVRAKLDVEALTGADGAYRLGPFERGEEVWLSARAPGLGSSRRVDVTAPREGLALRLARHLVRGRVVEADTATPVTRFQLTTFINDYEAHRRHAVENEDGVFEIPVDANVHYVLLQSEGRFPQRSPLVTNSDGGEYDLGELALDRERAVKGSVVDARTGAPVVGAWIFLHAEDLPPRAREGLILIRKSNVSTDEDGNFSLARVPARDTRIDVSADGYFKASVAVSPNAASLDIELAKAGVIAGSFALPDGSAPPGYPWIEPAGDDFFVHKHWGDGRFGSEPVPDGEYLVGVETGAGAVESRKVVIEGGRSVEDVHLVVQPHEGRLSGRITGLPPKQTAFVTVRDRKGRESHSLHLPNGEYALRGVPDFAIVTATTAAAASRLTRKVRLDDQGEAREDLDFSARSRLEGVVRAGGRPVGRVRVIVTPEDRSQPTASVTTTETGQYVASGLADGRHTVRARGRSFEVEVAGQSEFDIALSDGTVYGTALLAGTTAPAVGAVVQLTRVDGNRRLGAGMEDSVRNDGGFRFRGLAEGEYVVEAIWHFRMAPRRVRLGGGEALALSLELEDIDE